ncbi:hypothetical protein [Sneathiella sp. HT1-7]|uniref:hypothetical protein n=1 Tax=Sneathiella sp. HT1-7 TaxID=2887192 RepID=UPI001D13AFFA|nr:hypothetical protein [Sneathiella sp. HT1-7]MCC3305847.1 hypothetical protein [Sneathiella sp. HT1-7]
MTNWDTWKSAIPIEAAIITDVDETLREKYKTACQAELERSRYDQAIGSDIWPILEEAAELLPEAYIYEARELYYPKAPPEIINDWEADFIKLLISGKIQTIGFRAPRQPESSPKLLPPDTWEDWVDWHEGTVSANGITFVGVRIAPPDMLPSSQESEKSIGRPSRQNQINEAFHALYKEGLLDFSGPMKSNYPAIRQWVLANYPDNEIGERGLGDKTMANIVNPLIAKHK